MVEKTPTTNTKAQTALSNDDKFKLGIGIRVKITLTFFIFISAICLALALGIINLLNKELFREMQNRAKTTAQVGTMSIDRTALKYLVANAKPQLTPEKVAMIERSQGFKIVYDQLNAIRNVDRDFFRYAYILAPMSDNKLVYINDADLLADISESSNVPKAEITRYASPFDTNDFPNALRALKTKQPIVDNEFVYDKIFKFNSLTAYAPIFAADGKTLLAILALDTGDKEIQLVLGKVETLMIIIAAASLGIALLISLLLGGMFTAGIRHLDAIAQYFANDRFDVRAKISSRDEVGHLGFTFNTMAQAIQNYSHRLKAILTAYEKFVPHDFLDLLQKKSIIDIKLGDQAKREMTILFSDMRGFTSLSENMTPKENFDFINEYLSYIGPEIRAHNGFIDKYIGDAIMALFPGEAEDAVKAALAMLEKLKLFNEKRTTSNLPPIHIGIGIHVGKTMLGTIGEEERMDGSVIGDVVNLASRIETLTKKYDAQILISRRVLESLDNPRNYQHRFLDNMHVKGKNVSVAVYEIFQADPPEVKARKLEADAEFQRALTFYSNNQKSEALSLFEDLASRYPQDKVYNVYVKRCKMPYESGPEEE